MEASLSESSQQKTDSECCCCPDRCWMCQHSSKFWEHSALGLQAEAFIAAARDNDLSKLRQELEHGVPVDICLPIYGGTALDHAACCGHLEVVRFLVEEAHAPLETHNGVLGEAAYTGHVEVAEFLVDHAHVPVDYPGFYGCSALLSAIDSNQTAMVQFLLDRGAKPGTQAERSNHRGVQRGATALTTAATIGSHAIVQRLLDAKAPVNAADFTNKTALVIAAQSGQYDIVCSLVQANANVNYTSLHGWTALHYATYSAVTKKPDDNYHQRSQILKSLLQCAADPDVKTTNRRTNVPAGSTPIQIATNPKARRNPWQPEVLANFQHVVFNLELQQQEAGVSKHQPAVVTAHGLSGELTATVTVDLKQDDLEALQTGIKHQSGVPCCLQQLVFDTSILEDVPLCTKLVKCLKGNISCN